MRIDVRLDAQRVAAGIGSHMKRVLQPILDTQVLKDSNYYIPFDTGTLEASGATASRIGSGEIVWNTPYARKMYYGVDFNFSKDSNPNARAKWFEEAKAKRKREWENILNAHNR